MNYLFLVLTAVVFLLIFVVRKVVKKDTYPDVYPGMEIVDPAVKLEFDGRGAKWSKAATVIAMYQAMWGEYGYLGNLEKLSNSLNRTSSSLDRKVTRLETYLRGNDGDPTDMDEEVFHFMSELTEVTARMLAYKAIIDSTINPACKKFFEERLDRV